MEVFTTNLALLENHKVNTIMIPAINKKSVGVGTLASSTCMLNSWAGTPDITQAS